MGSEFPVQSTPDAVCVSPGTSQEKGQFIHSTLTAKSLSLSLSVIVSLPHIPSGTPPFHPSLYAILDAPRPPAEDRFIMSDEFAIPAVEDPGRAKRSPIDSNSVGGLNVETLVVADRKLLEKHGRDNVTTYVLTVMNMVRVEGEGKDVKNKKIFSSSVSTNGWSQWNGNA